LKNLFGFEKYPRLDLFGEALLLVHFLQNRFMNDVHRVYITTLLCMNKSKLGTPLTTIHVFLPYVLHYMADKLLYITVFPIMRSDYKTSFVICTCLPSVDDGNLGLFPIVFGYLNMNIYKDKYFPRYYCLWSYNMQK